MAVADNEGIEGNAAAGADAGRLREIQPSSTEVDSEIGANSEA